MRLNPLHPSDNPMEQVLYCFGGPDDTGGGSAGDFDDTVRLSGDTRPAYESEVEEKARAKGGGTYDDQTLSDDRSFNLAQTRVAESRAGLPEGTYVRGRSGKPVMSSSGPLLSGRAVEKAAQEQGTTSSDIFNRARSSYFSTVPGARGPSTGSAPSETSEFLPEIFPGAMTMEGVKDIDSLTPQDLRDFRTFSNARAQGIPLGASTEGDIIARAEALGLSSDIFNPDLAEEFDPPGGGAQLTGIPGVTVGDSPAQKQIQAARGPTAMTMEGNIPLDLQGAIALNVGPVDPVPEQSTVQQEPLDPATNVDPVDDFTPDFLSSAMTGPREEVYNVAAPERTFPSPYEQFIGAPNIQTSQGRAPEQTDMRSFRTGLPSSVEVLGAKVPTGIGVLEGVVNAVTDPKGTFEQALYNQGAKSIDGEDTGNETGLEVITVGDRTAAYDPRSNIVYDTNPFDFSGITPEIQRLYDKKRQRDEQDRGSRGGDDPIIPPLIPEDPLAQDQAPEPVVGQNVITGANYQPREPVQFAYTGLPTLAPVSLQPTFQAQRQFTPTFGLGALRRS